MKTLTEIIQEAEKEGGFIHYLKELDEREFASARDEIIKEFYAVINRVATQTKEAMMVEEMKTKNPILYKEIGWNSARKEMLANYEKFIGKI